MHGQCDGLRIGLEDSLRVAGRVLRSNGFKTEVNKVT